MSHTEGKLRVSGSNEMDTIEIWCGLERVANCNVSKAIGYPTKKENARRLVSCWNACDGIPTEALETHDIFCAQTNVALKNTDLKQELDTLRKAAERLVRLWDKDGDGISDFIDITEREIENLRAALGQTK